MEMPEEINRIVTDRLSSLYFTPSADADTNLLREGVEKGKVHMVGNVMIDTLLTLLPKIETARFDGVQEGAYGVVTLHRPSNVDDPAKFGAILAELVKIAERVPLVFPVHPRTRKILEQIGIHMKHKQIIFTDPLGYIEFLGLVRRSQFVVTDSGGIQEETTYLGVPCLTLRKNTERPITVSMGTNTLVGENFNLLEEKIEEIQSGAYKKGEIPALWDGKAAERIAEVMVGK